MLFFASFSERRSFYLILGLTLTGVAALACIIIFGYACRRRIAHMFKKGENSFFFLSYCINIFEPLSLYNYFEF
jgi:hypothetical protein